MCKEYTPKILDLIYGKAFSFTGECRQCGSCCKETSLYFGGRAIRSVDEFNEICEEDPSFKAWIPYKKDRTGNIVFCCDNILKNNKCGMYLERPVVCKEYPIKDVILKPFCGYKQRINDYAYEIKDIKLIEKIATIAIYNNNYGQAFKLLRSAKPSIRTILLMFVCIDGKIKFSIESVIDKIWTASVKPFSK